MGTACARGSFAWQLRVGGPFFARNRVFWFGAAEFPTRSAFIGVFGLTTAAREISSGHVPTVPIVHRAVGGPLDPPTQPPDGWMDPPVLLPPGVTLHT